MVKFNRQLDKFKDNLGNVHIYKMHEAFPHLYDENGNRKRDIYIEFDEANENLLVETMLDSDVMQIKRIGQFIQKRKAFITQELKKLNELKLKYNKQLKAMDAVLADRGLRELTKADCCRTMYEEPQDGKTDNRGCVCILPLDFLTIEYRKPEYQLFRIGNGFGCTPSGRGNACYGYFCVNGEEARIEKFEFLGVGNEEVEKIAQELEAGWAGDASRCTEKEREPDGLEM